MKSNLFNLEQEVAVVLGGTGVLGGAMAEALAAAGARVAIVGRNEERGQARVRSIEANDGQALFHPADALDRDSLLQARNAIEAQWGTASVLVNAAGGNRPDATLPPGADFCHLPARSSARLWSLPDEAASSTSPPCQA
jgi:NAD(P)-dependent dehydrogenase (short-subunit alcohol dehydrogenase family)